MGDDRPQGGWFTDVITEKEYISVEEVCIRNIRYFFDMKCDSLASHRGGLQERSGLVLYKLLS